MEKIAFVSSKLPAKKGTLVSSKLPAKKSTLVKERKRVRNESQLQRWTVIGKPSLRHSSQMVENSLRANDDLLLIS